MSARRQGVSDKCSCGCCAPSGNPALIDKDSKGFPGGCAEGEHDTAICPEAYLAVGTKATRDLDREI